MGGGDFSAVPVAECGCTDGAGGNGEPRRGLDSATDWIHGGRPVSTGKHTDAGWDGSMFGGCGASG